MADPFENIVELPFLKDQELEEQQSPFSKQISLNPYQTGGTVGGTTIVKSEVKIISKFTAGEAITKNDALYFKAADSKVYKTDADAAGTTDNFIGFAVNNITSGELGDVQLSGRMNGFSGLTAGTIYYLSGTAGALSSTAGTIVRRALLATAADEGIIIKDAFGSVVKTEIFTADDTWTKATGAILVEVICIGAGGGGGSGRRASGGAGGGGGGGGSATRAMFLASSLGATETITVGTGGTGGAAQTVDSTNGNAGNNGGSSSFGSWLFSGGGGGGLGGTTASVAGGGGGGAIGSASTSTGGTPNVNGDAIGGQGPDAISGAASRNAEFGGGAGGQGTAGAGSAGGSSIYAAGAGGGGGAGGNGGGAGGRSQSYSVGGGGAGGASGAAGTAGNSNATDKRGYGGAGGGGGGGTTTAGAGGAGGIPGGAGGGGGNSANGNNSGAGGGGARGEIRVYTIF